MVKANPPLDKKGEKLLKDVQAQFDAFLTSGNGTTLADSHAKLIAALDVLAKHRYAQFGVMEPQATRR
jgi:hypothetical protein